MRTSPSLLLPATLLLQVGCKKPVEAPTSLEDLMGWVFAEVPEDDEGEALSVGADSMNAWMDAHFEETFETGYTVAGLNQDTVDALGGAPRDLSDLYGVAVGYAQVNGVDALVATVMTDPQVAHPDVYLAYDYEDLEGSAACIADHSCDWLERETWSTQSYALGLEITSHLMVQYRWFDTEQGPAFVFRNWSVEPPTSNKEDWLNFSQVYFTWMFLPSAGGARSMQASWVVAEVLGGSVDPESVVKMWVNGMQSSAEDLDQGS